MVIKMCCVDIKQKQLRKFYNSSETFTQILKKNHNTQNPGKNDLMVWTRLRFAI